MTELDLGLSHIALPITDLSTSVEFYRRFANMEVLARLTDERGAQSAQLSDLTRAFSLILMQRADGAGLGQLGGWAHLGVSCLSRDDVDRRLAEAASAGYSIIGPIDDGEPLGYWGIIVDPDGHNLQLGCRVDRTTGSH